MNEELIQRVLTKVLNREFRSRRELGLALGIPRTSASSYVSRLKERAVALGLVDPRQWEFSFATGKNGQRGKDKGPRKATLGPTAKKILERLNQEAPTAP